MEPRADRGARHALPPPPPPPATDHALRRGRARGGREAGLLAPAPLLVLILLCAAGQAAADIISLSGNLVLGVSSGNVCNLTAAGLGVGTIVPSANLHVAGNALVSGAVVVGGTANTSGSNLHVSGSLGLSVQSVSSNTTLSGNSLVLADTSGNSLTLTLPAASTMSGRTYWVKKTSANNTLTVSGGGNLIDGMARVLLTSGGNGYPYCQLLSDGSGWNLLSAPSSGSATAHGLGDELGWWCPSLDSLGYGTNVLYDQSGHGYHGVLTNMDPATDWVSDTANGGSRALDLDGNNDFIRADGPQAILAGNAQGTISAWVYRTTGTNSTFGFGKTLNAGRFSILWFTDNVVYCQAENGSAAYESYTLASSGWTHVAIVYDGSLASTSRIAVYINGSLVASAGSTNATTLNTAALLGPFDIGVESARGLYTTGKVDDIRLFSRALGAAEVAMLASRRGY